MGEAVTRRSHSTTRAVLPAETLRVLSRSQRLRRTRISHDLVVAVPPGAGRAPSRNDVDVAPLIGGASGAGVHARRWPCLPSSSSPGTTAQSVLFGYHLVRVTTPPEQVENNYRRLAAFAKAKGLTLGSVFVEQDASRPWWTLSALIEAARHFNVTAVAVPRATDLGFRPLLQEATRRRLETDAGMRVYVLDPGA